MESTIQTLWNAKHTNVAAINDATVTILDEFMNEEYSIEINAPIIKKIWLNNSTFRFNNKQLVRNGDIDNDGVKWKVVDV